ncbi:branched-chain amino acid transport system ATP-binding protein [Rhizobium leguminosarum]|uniref:Branched-chain amino acid transport system ATP-binding protein n=1 Tax=Rhizobium leguminosarum TaxID=384 RepID=A0AAE2MRU1_RHILE|nr:MULTISPECIES: ABC transporter ATP-binding protein [Rhizobium]ARM90993.1 branched-chain amino acid ABC transporter ATP-binding protein [Rhizobium sp. CIAT894]MBB4293854.1 branched-chain amino acid transport system ATP-binding protein [Rhizobium leguminosarum]MBB4299587.1 branched-chain amino acid transport system ATP-binding protein [Rhizobium leguminosarum]MBB4311024.1 branched-chain amino acid transport system ATP-binding protein [Rhizobium leguminosarum]MBB4420127.1 branched-chain amino a
MTTLLRVETLTKRFGGFTALSDVNLNVAKGERLGLIGPNGSGKTTLINCISGVVQIDQGAIAFENRDISALAAYKRAKKGIARTFQIPRPFHSMSVIENLMVPLEYIVHGLVDGSNRNAVHAEASELLHRMRLSDRTNAPAGQLSQVELRKLELARAVAARPRLLICDEAMAGLATKEVHEILDILMELNASGITIIMVEHILQAVMRFSQRIVCLTAGRIISDGAPVDVMANPEVRRAYLGS